MASSSPKTEPVRLGVTGHRLLADEDKLRAAVREALGLLAGRFPDRPIFVYSALAEGADRLVVEEACDLADVSFVAVLPLPVDDYARDFSPPSSKQQFRQLLSKACDVIELPNSRTRDDAYWLAGRYVVEQADILLALWDGLPAHGRSGTADVVAYSRERSQPLIWIKAGNREPGSGNPTTLGVEQGKLTVENFD